MEKSKEELHAESVERRFGERYKELPYKLIKITGRDKNGKAIVEEIGEIRFKKGKFPVELDFHIVPHVWGVEKRIADFSLETD